MKFVGGPSHGLDVPDEMTGFHVLYVRAQPFTVWSADERERNFGAGQLAGVYPYTYRQWHHGAAWVPAFVDADMSEVSFDQKMRKLFASLPVLTEPPPKDADSVKEPTEKKEPQEPPTPDTLEIPTMGGSRRK